MGQYYKAPQGQFLDFIYKPDRDLQLAVANKEVQLDASKKAFASNTDYVSQPTFLGWQEDLDKSVGSLNEKIDPIVQKLVENPSDKEAYKSFKNLTQDARDSYSSGDIGYMTRHYGSYQNQMQKIDKMVAGIKDPTERTMYLDSQKKWRKHVTDNVLDYKGRYKEFGFNDFISPLDAQKNLADNIDPEKMKSDIESYAKSKDGNLLAQKFPGVDFQYYVTKYGQEGYQRGAIEFASKQHLMNNPAYMAMLKQNFMTFNERLEGQNLDETSAEAFQKYAESQINKQANTYTNKFTGKKVEVDIDKYKDELGLHQAKAKAKATNNTSYLTTVGRSKKLLQKDELIKPLERFLDLLPQYSGGKKDLTSPEGSEFLSLKEAFKPLLENTDPAVVSTLGTYLPMADKDSFFGDREGIYDLLYEDIKKELPDLANVSKEEFKKVFGFTNMGIPKDDNEVSAYVSPSYFSGNAADAFSDDPYAGSKKLRKEVGEFSDRVGFKSAGILSNLIEQKFINITKAEALYRQMQDGGSELSAELEKSSVVNEQFIVTPSIRPENIKTPIVQSTLDHVASVATSGNQPDVVPTQYTSSTYEGVQRGLTGKDAIDPINSIRAKLARQEGKNLSVEEMLSKNYISVNIKPYSDNSEEWEVFDNTDLDENGAPRAYNLIYKNVPADNYWGDMAQYAKDPESIDMIQKAKNPTYNKLASEVNARVATLDNPENSTNLGALKDTPLSAYYQTYIELDPDSKGSYQIVWVDKNNPDSKQYMKGLTQTQATVYISKENTIQKLIDNISK